MALKMVAGTSEVKITMPTKVSTTSEAKTVTAKQVAVKCSDFGTRYVGTSAQGAMKLTDRCINVATRGEILTI